jgi:hypothetical protein
MSPQSIQSSVAYTSLGGNFRQRISPVTIKVVSGVTIFSVLLFLISLYHPVLSPQREAMKKLPPGGKLEPANSVLMLLPKDRKGDNDYGFHNEWLEMAITQRKQYAEHHGKFSMGHCVDVEHN